jgi:hypothetical protein
MCGASIAQANTTSVPPLSGPDSESRAMLQMNATDIVLSKASENDDDLMRAAAHLEANVRRWKCI